MLSFGFCLLLLWQQDEILSEPLATETVQDRFTEAIEKFNSVQRIESKPLFEAIIETLEQQVTYDEDEHLIMTESLKYMGVITYPEQTETYFEKLIRFDPAYEISSKDFPPKIVAVFDNLKQNLAGRVRVSAVDADTGVLLEEAGLSVDDKLVGPVHGESLFHVLAGTRMLEIRKPNYAPANQELEVLPDEESSFQAVMFRNASELVLVTHPAGAEVFLGEQSQGLAEDAAPRGYFRKLRELNLEPTEAGSTTLNELMPGTYTITFRKPCFQPKITQLEIDQHKRWLIEPIQLEPAAAYLNVNTASQASGIVFLDQTRVGFLPVENYRVCPGEYDLRVRFTDGEFVRRVRFDDGSRLNVIAEPLPSIAWFGVQVRDEGDPPQDVAAWLRDLKTWNVHAVDPNDTSKVPVNPLPFLFGSRDISPENQALLTRQLQADLYMAARVVRKKVVIRHLEIAFWTPLSRRIEVMSFDFREIDKFQELLKAIDGFPPLVKPWLGIQLAKLSGLPGCKVIEVHPNGPLAGKIQTGELIRAVNGNLLKSPGDLIAWQDTDELTLAIGERQVVVTPLATMAEVPFDTVATAPQALLAKFEKLAKYHPDPLVRQSALFNQARYQFFLGDFKEAFDIFSTLTLDTEFGINQGTLYFYQGLCFRRLKLASEAMASFGRVLDYPHATLFDAYGPKAAFWAEAEMKNTNL